MKVEASDLYGKGCEQARLRFLELEAEFQRRFGQTGGRFFSSPGRTEIGGNHTDHNKGSVLAAAVTLDMKAVARRSGDGLVTLYSEGFSEPFLVGLSDLEPRKEEEGTSRALIRGILQGLQNAGFQIGGFQAVMRSDVRSGSGLSSSAAFELLVAAIIDGLYNDGEIDGIARAKACQWAENRHFGKPSGLMDQSACSLGGLIAIDFGGEEPTILRFAFDFDAAGYSPVVLSTGSSHDDLTAEYAAIPAEMRAVAACFGKQTLSELREEDFAQALPRVREALGDRALLRAMHFFAETRRAKGEAAALQSGDLSAFLRLVVESGESSWKLLQNLYVPGGRVQPLALACALSDEMLRGRGAWRVHGGGFAGTILAFVPKADLDAYIQRMDAVFDRGACEVLGIRTQGACEVGFQEPLREVFSYEIGTLPSYKYVTTLSRVPGGWLFGRHRARGRWEAQGGHIEAGETPLAAAKRELYEESGALEYKLVPICDSTFGAKPYEGEGGRLFWAEISRLGPLPQSEIAEVAVFRDLPEDLGFPELMRTFLRQVKAHIGQLRRTGSEGETEAFGESIGKGLKNGDILLLEGGLGAGKTALTRGLVRGLGGDANEVSSPTFALMQSYGARWPVHHFDLYRLSSAQEAEEAGLAETLRGGEGVCVVEWPGQAEGLFDGLNAKTIALRTFEGEENAREIELSGDWFGFSLWDGEKGEGLC
ncbi:MAG: tRNA (adenosine(37)-N6)-threonylcarbamoyltransferase complex ATPase subunit type 1 TsaE [Christensenellaceae bacterium]|nr:tRNA (adenosine(37)-N6)-threonylcarbamoyltransferase complex ATPase subunit type 1 TsaE [Christensenellaceae bacterium]